MVTPYIYWSEDGKPQLNTWYHCLQRDDWYKILKDGIAPDGSVLYKIVSYRNGSNVFFGLTLKQARAAIRIETYLSTIYGW